MKQIQQRRVVITGLGVVAPNGIGKNAFWQANMAGRSGVIRLPQEHELPIQVAGVVQNFLVEDYIERKLANRSDRMTHFAFAAIQEALADAQLSLTQENPQRVGAVIANTMGGVNYVLEQLQALYTRGPRFMSAYTAIAWLHVATIGQTAIRHSIQGYCKTPVNDTVGGLDALGMAYGAIRRGAADVIISGGCEAFLNPFILLILSQQGQYVTGTDLSGYRPFDQRASGLVLAEGAGICILEEYQHALDRGATIYGEITGYGQSNDAHGLLPPSSNGTRYARALCQAIQSGQMTPDDVNYLSLDGRAWPESDQGEFDGLRQVFGPRLPQIPASVPRTMFGHSYAAAGAIDTITTLLALKYGRIPPTINCDHPDTSYELNLVRDKPLSLTASRDQQVALVGGRGTGGTNVALALRRER
ncbi:3-oxoacyl-[acyl-carrier-protein] synthase 2 [Dictyobacter alpinus]|uniref:3-oxoacyl-[acyl-carrier-protein] synthase 2 n=1 Tax=Dictyobacter alpinus TaxID=2014873 RepID=A0A402B7K4_9CHLR|nr:beta-ketoacyl-[acyl-carrier-protein] synthase family protein [Dictyobacter alpinus]GCE27334.1 3-oxoacyl-[acyl-carrier-protein] synthase 2 [Dictyobacter alpinus]